MKKVSKNSKENFLTFFSNKKKGSANMWWIIIGAVIALVVLIILLVIFTDQTTSLEGGLLDCGSKGGVCVNPGSCDTSNGTPSSAFTCAGEKECCFGCKPNCQSQ